MGHPALTLRRASWLICACLLLLPHSAIAAEPSLAIDFDGDGWRDHVTLDRQEPTLLHVWLSASNTTEVIRNRVPLMRVSAVDIDGDHQPELIASDQELRIQVWSRTHKGFHPRRPRPIIPTAGKRPTGHRVDDSDALPDDEIAGNWSAPLGLALCASLHPLGSELRHARAPRTVGACRSFIAVDPFRPRPPPALLSL